MRNATLVTLPFSTVARVRTSPAGVSMFTSVTSPVMGTRPLSNMAVTQPMVLCPHMGMCPPASMNRMPMSASGWHGSTQIVPDMLLCPRGSIMTAVRSQSRCSSA